MEPLPDTPQDGEEQLFYILRATNKKLFEAGGINQALEVEINHFRMIARALVIASESCIAAATQAMTLPDFASNPVLQQLASEHKAEAELAMDLANRITELFL